jgi:hypothetical protein
MDCAEEIGSSADFEGYGYVARITPIRMMWGIKRRMRGKRPLNCSATKSRIQEMGRTDERIGCHPNKCSRRACFPKYNFLDPVL